MPEGSEPAKVVVNGEEIPLTPEDIERGYVVIPPDKVKPGEDNTVELVVERKPLPGDSVRPTEKDKPTSANDGRYWIVSTGIAGGQGTVTPSAEVTAGENYIVSWSANTGYRVAKVLVDGVERPDLLEASSVTFDRLSTNHSVQVVLEAVPETKDPSDDGNGGQNPGGDQKPGGQNPGAGTTDGDNAGPGKSDDRGSSSDDQQKTTRLTRLAQTGDTTSGFTASVTFAAIASLLVLLAVSRRRKNQ